jgi:hypothetical protein
MLKIIFEKIILEVEQYRIGGNLSYLHAAIFGMPISFLGMAIFTPLYFLKVANLEYAFFVFMILSTALFLMFLLLFTPNFIWERRKYVALNGKKAMARIVKVYKSIALYYRGRPYCAGCGDYYNYIMIIEFKNDQMETVRNTIAIDEFYYNRIRPCDILVHTKGN